MILVLGEWAIVPLPYSTKIYSKVTTYKVKVTAFDALHIIVSALRVRG